MYGTQAELYWLLAIFSFENDVNMYGTQAGRKTLPSSCQFENDVNMYGTQASNYGVNQQRSLRMM